MLRSCEAFFSCIQDTLDKRLYMTDFFLYNVAIVNF